MESSQTNTSKQCQGPRTMWFMFEQGNAGSMAVDDHATSYGTIRPLAQAPSSAARSAESAQAALEVKFGPNAGLQTSLGGTSIQTAADEPKLFEPKQETAIFQTEASKITTNTTRSPAAAADKDNSKQESEAPQIDETEPEPEAVKQEATPGKIKVNPNPKEPKDFPTGFPYDPIYCTPRSYQEIENETKQMIDDFIEANTQDFDRTATDPDYINEYKLFQSDLLANLEFLQDFIENRFDKGADTIPEATKTKFEKLIGNPEFKRSASEILAWMELIRPKANEAKAYLEKAYLLEPEYIDEWFIRV